MDASGSDPGRRRDEQETKRDQDARRCGRQVRKTRRFLGSERSETGSPVGPALFLENREVPRLPAPNRRLGSQGRLIRKWAHGFKNDSHRLGGVAGAGGAVRLMDATASPAHDRTLVQALTGIVSDLRSRQLGVSRQEPRESLRGAADRFVGTLADHLRYTEDSLFPALRELTPGADHALEGMEEGHRLLRRHVGDLALRIKTESDEGAYETARLFLATVLDHFGRETAMVEGIVHSLDAPQTRRLTELLSLQP